MAVWPSVYKAVVFCNRMCRRFCLSVTRDLLYVEKKMCFVNAAIPGLVVTETDQNKLQIFVRG